MNAVTWMSNFGDGLTGRVARSFLFVPGQKLDRIEKAMASGAHAIVLDIEDAVPPQAKAAARSAVASLLASGHRAIVRVNPPHTEWYADDLRMLQAVPFAGVMLPKAELQSLTSMTEALPGRPIIALLETVRGFLELDRLSRVVGLTRIAFGSVDFEAESGLADEGDAMTSIRVQIVLHSKDAGLAAPIDGASVNFNDGARMEADALRSSRLGFGGKLCIHPNQVAPINSAFLPTPAQVNWAQRVITAFIDSGGAATAVDGRMIDKPVFEQARRILTSQCE